MRGKEISYYTEIIVLTQLFIHPMFACDREHNDSGNNRSKVFLTNPFFSYPWPDVIAVILSIFGMAHPMSS